MNKIRTITYWLAPLMWLKSSSVKMVWNWNVQRPPSHRSRQERPPYAICCLGSWGKPLRLCIYGSYLVVGIVCVTCSHARRGASRRKKYIDTVNMMYLIAVREALICYFQLWPLWLGGAGVGLNPYTSCDIIYSRRVRVRSKAWVRTNTENRRRRVRT